jgi:hypothetical protein
VLKPGGSLLLSTPNLAAWYNRGLLAVGVQPVFSEVSLRGVYGRPGSQVAGHLRIFTRRALVGLLAGRGFGDIAVAGACYHDVPRPLRPLDRVMTAWPDAASILLVRARKPGTQDVRVRPNVRVLRPPVMRSRVLRIYHRCNRFYRCRQLAGNMSSGSDPRLPSGGTGDSYRNERAEACCFP